jgi:membrane fusion protein (multidrug efflux system)
MSEQGTTSEKTSWVYRQRKNLIIGVPTLCLGIIIAFYLLNERYQSTDDAYIRAAQVQITSNVSGRVTSVEVKDNQKVQAGDLLFKIDDQPFKIAVAEASAHLENTRLQIMALKSTYQQHKANQQAAKETLQFQTKEFKRQKALAAKSIISKSQLDQAQHLFEQAKSSFRAAHEQSLNVLASLGHQPNLPVEQHPSVQQAQAALDRANLNLSYATVYAPVDGIVAKVEQLQTGSYVNASVPQFVLISTKNIWVEANFKEDQLSKIRQGQSATFTIDTYPGEVFIGKVTSVSPGTGSIFSILPAENATGNWVKVVQRLPIRLSIDHASTNLPLAAGLSVTVEVDTSTAFPLEHNP